MNTIYNCLTAFRRHVVHRRPFISTLNDVLLVLDSVCRKPIIAQAKFNLENFFSSCENLCFQSYVFCLNYCFCVWDVSVCAWFLTFLFKLYLFVFALFIFLTLIAAPRWRAMCVEDMFDCFESSIETLMMMDSFCFRSCNWRKIGYWFLLSASCTWFTYRYNHQWSNH